MQLPISHFSYYIAPPTIAFAPFSNSISASGCSSNIAIQVQVLLQLLVKENQELKQNYLELQRDFIEHILVRCCGSSI